MNVTIRPLKAPLFAKALKRLSIGVSRQSITSKQTAIINAMDPITSRSFDDRLLIPTNIESLRKAGHCACCLRAVNVIKSPFYGLGCHLSLCMLLKLRFLVDSIPYALTISFQ
jgi:hypothetical protein